MTPPTGDKAAGPPRSTWRRKSLSFGLKDAVKRRRGMATLSTLPEELAKDTEDPEHNR